MNKIKKILALGLAFGVFAGGVTAIANSKNGMKVAKATDPETYIEMKESFFTNWTSDAGSFAASSATFWGEGYSFEALDTFFRGESKEGWTGTLTSRTWKQTEQYIYFQLGGARDYDHPEGAVHLVIHYGANSSDFYNNTFVENPMTLRYFKIPDNEYNTLIAANPSGFDMSIDIVDPCIEGYGFANFGYLHVNQTAESTSDAMRYFLNNLSTDMREWEINKRRDIQNSYLANASQRELFLRTVSNVNEDFEDNDVFLNHWYFDHNFFNNASNARHFDSIISTASARTAESSNMPYNKTGNGLFKGWYDNNGSGGFTGDGDNAVYRFISRPFVLSGTGLVSIKMAGRSASLHVFDTATQSELAWVDVKTYNPDGGQDNVALGGMNTVTMVRHVINLEAYVGRTIQLGIADIYDSGWGTSYFDELVTNYVTAPGYKIDYTVQSNNTGTFYPAYLDVYVNSANFNEETNKNAVKYNGDNDINKANDNEILNHVDNSAAKAAHGVVKSYFDYVRGGKEGLNDICDKKTEAEMKAIVEAYADLSETAKRIVCASYDFARGSGTWYQVEPTLYGPTHEFKLSRTIQYLADLNGVSTVTYSNGMAISTFGFQMDSTAMIIVAISSVIALIAFGLAFLNKKKKANR